MADMKKQKKDRMKENVGKPVEDWVDCWEKYLKIVENCK